MRTADVDRRRAETAANYTALETDCDLLRQENHVLTASLDRSKDTIAAVIEQREKLAAKLREAKR